MRWLRRLLGIKETEPRRHDIVLSRIELPTGHVATTSVHYVEDAPRGTVRYGGKIYWPGGPPDDPTPQWQGPFPPAGHLQPKPVVGGIATVCEGSAPKLSRAIITDVGARFVTVRVEYRDTWRLFRCTDGGWIEKGHRGKNAPTLVIGIHASTVKSLKSWYRLSTLARDVKFPHDI